MRSTVTADQHNRHCRHNLLRPQTQTETMEAKQTAQEIDQGGTAGCQTSKQLY